MFHGRRYGNAILFRPPLAAETAWVWLAPVIALLGGFVVAIVIVRKRSAMVDGDDTCPTSLRQKSRVDVGLHCARWIAGHCGRGAVVVAAPAASRGWPSAGVLTEIGVLSMLLLARRAYAALSSYS